jgi:hypothetical protein
MRQNSFWGNRLPDAHKSILVKVPIPLRHEICLRSLMIRAHDQRQLMLHGQEPSLVRTGTRHSVAWLVQVAMWEVDWSGNNSNESRIDPLSSEIVASCFEVLPT